MMERTDDGGFRFVFSRDRQEFDASTAYATERAWGDRIPRALRMNRRLGILFVAAFLVLCWISFFRLTPGSSWFGVMMPFIGISGMAGYMHLRLSRRHVLLRVWMKQALHWLDEDSVVYVLQQNEIVVTHDGLRCLRPDLQCAYSWSAIRSIECSDHEIMFWIRNGSIYCVPLRLFDDHAGRDGFLETVRAWHAEAHSPEQAAMG